MKTLLTMLVLLASAVSAQAQATNKYQSCTGILMRDIFEDEDNDHLNHARGGLWCDASLPSNLQSKILKVCKLGDYCQVTGTFSGRGTFEWTRIYSVRKLPTPRIVE